MEGEGDMKATINGVTVEGTPQEIFDLMCRSGDAGYLRNSKQSDSVRPKCPNEGQACYCTGACVGRVPADVLEYSTT
jgi:hypothetical protein